MAGLVSVQICMAFSDALKNVLGMMAQTDVTPGKLAFKSSLPGLDMATLSVKIEVHGWFGKGRESADQKRATMVLTFPEATIIDIASQLLGEEYIELTEEVEDCACEIANMVSGGARQVLEEMDYDFDMALPFVVDGRAFPEEQDPSVLPFESTAGKFQLELFMEDVE